MHTTIEIASLVDGTCQAIRYWVVGEFKDRVPHTGGVLTIHKKDKAYSLGYRHSNPNRMALVQLLAIGGKPVAFVPIHGMSSREDPPPPQVMTFLPTDGEGMFGRKCPNCNGYFRTEHVQTKFCPYCPTEMATSFKFFTAHQLDFIARQHDAILAALAGPDGDISVNFDDQLAAGTGEGSWIYSEERQQTHFKCARCSLQCDVLGEYVRCPECGKRTAREVIGRKLHDLSRDFESDAVKIPKTERQERQRRWRSYVPACVAEFEALGRDVAGALALLPHTPARRKAITELSFQNPVGTAARVHDWFGFDFLESTSAADRTFLHVSFNRRHLFQHLAGKVDPEYLDRTGDESARLHEVVHVASNDVRRLLRLTTNIATDLLDGFDSIS